MSIKYKIIRKLNTDNTNEGSHVIRVIVTRHKVEFEGYDLILFPNKLKEIVHQQVIALDKCANDWFCMQM